MKDKIVEVEVFILDTETVVDVTIPIPQDKWEYVIKEAVEEIGVVIDEEFMEPFSEEDDVKEAEYLDLDGFSHSCTGRQAYIATCLGYVPASACDILDHAHALGTLRDAVIKELETNQPEKEKVIQLLKDIADEDLRYAFSDMDSSYYDDEDEDDEPHEREQICSVQYPDDLLDELAERIIG